MTDKKSPVLVLNIQFREEKDICDYANRYAHIECRFQVFQPYKYREGQGWQDYEYDWQNPAKFDVESFTISGTMTKRIPEWSVYGWSAKYQNRSVDLEDAERMLKTLKAIKAGLEKAKEEDGEVISFGQWCLRICKALGVKQMSYRNTFAENNTAVVSLANGMAHIDYLTAQQKRDWESETQKALNAREVNA